MSYWALQQQQQAIYASTTRRGGALQLPPPQHHGGGWQVGDGQAPHPLPPQPLMWGAPQAAQAPQPPPLQGAAGPGGAPPPHPTAPAPSVAGGSRSEWAAGGELRPAVSTSTALPAGRGTGVGAAAASARPVSATRVGRAGTAQWRLLSLPVTACSRVCAGVGHGQPKAPTATRSLEGSTTGWEGSVKATHIR